MELWGYRGGAATGWPGLFPKCAEAGMQVFRSGGVSPNKSREMVRLRWLTTPIYSEEWKTGLFMEAETERCAMGKRRRKAPCHPLN